MADIKTDEAQVVQEELPQKKKHKGMGIADNPLSITSLMDALTILLIFLLKSYGSDPMQVPQKKNELMVPKSDSMSNMVECVDIQISRTTIVVKGKKIVAVNNGSVSSSDTPDGFTIKAVKDVLDEIRQKEIEAKGAQGGESAFQGDAFIAADTSIPWKLVNQVMMTCTRAKYVRFSFAIVKTRGG